MADPIASLNAALTGRYEVVRELGEGGMAVVYLADDLRHHRRVALKVLKPELAAVVGAERFLAEIETTAKLQHPHILPLFDSGEADGFLFYVMPYVEGESMRDRLDRDRQLAVDESVRIATDLAEALDYAHRQGVIHRDIKPANILLHEGRPLIADFGIALALGAAGGTRLTETGLSVGTPYYMSPEQATGDMVVGPATDIYALGCVLYEMLVGEPPYTGATAQAVLGRIIQGRAVSATEQRSSIPANVDAAVRKALEKIPADRFTTARDFGEALADPTFRHGTAGTAGEAGPESRRWRGVALAAGGLAAALAAALGWALLRPAPPPAVARYALSFAPGQEPVDGLDQTFALAPDGSSIVYVGPGTDGGRQLWLKRRAETDAVPLAGTEGAWAPVVSPDGGWVAYRAPGQGVSQLRKIPLIGGAAVTIADSVNQQSSGPPAWLDDGTIVYVAVGQVLRRVPADGGPADSIWARPADDSRVPYFPRALPGSRGILFSLCDGGCRSGQEVWALDLSSGEAHSVVPGATLADYVSTGHLVYVRPDGAVFAVPFDLGSLETRGAAVPVLEDVKVDGSYNPELALSPDGTLLMRTGGAASGNAREAEFVWVTRDGVATPVQPGWTFDPGPTSGLWGWSLSPDGTRLAARIATDGGTDIWIKELPRGPLSRLTLDEGDDFKPRWTPGGDTVTFLSARGGNTAVWAKRADGVGAASLIYAYEGNIYEAVRSPDGTRLVFRVGGSLGTRDILAVQPDADTVATMLMGAGYDETQMEISPDSRWIAYASDESGRLEVFVRPFPDVDGGRWQVSTNGGGAPLWSHSGRELFFFDGELNLVAVQVETEPRFRVGEATTLFNLSDGYIGAAQADFYDVSTDDQRFLMARRVEPAAETAGDTVAVPEPRTILVENWLEELKEKVGR